MRNEHFLIEPQHPQVFSPPDLLMMLTSSDLHPESSEKEAIKGAEPLYALRGAGVSSAQV